MPAGRPHALSNPEFCQKVAEGFAEGWSRQQMADHFDIKDLATITRWRKDPRIKPLLTTLINDRVREVTRKVDAKIAAVLERDDLTVTELLAIRKEFLGGALRQEAEKADGETIQQAMQAAEDPGFQEKLAALFAEHANG
jgi:hypothetical protein